MNSKKIITMLFVVFIIICSDYADILAMTTGFTTEEVDLEEQREIFDNIGLYRRTTEVKDQPIKCFAVNENGLIALGFDSSGSKQISVYTSDGEFQYGYTFISSGSYGVEWDGDNLTICFSRGSLCASYDEKGAGLEITTIQRTDNNRKYWDYGIFSTKQTIEDTQYKLKKNGGIFGFLAPNYSQLVSIDENGTETILYDVSKSESWKIILVVTGVLAAVIGVVVYLTKLVKTSIKNNNNNKF